MLPPGSQYYCLVCVTALSLLLPCVSALSLLLHWTCYYSLVYVTVCLFYCLKPLLSCAFYWVTRVTPAFPVSLCPLLLCPWLLLLPCHFVHRIGVWGLGVGEYDGVCMNCVCVRGKERECVF